MPVKLYNLRGSHATGATEIYPRLIPPARGGHDQPCPSRAGGPRVAANAGKG